MVDLMFDEDILMLGVNVIDWWELIVKNLLKYNVVMNESVILLNVCFREFSWCYWSFGYCKVGGGDV